MALWRHLRALRLNPIGGASLRNGSGGECGEDPDHGGRGRARSGPGFNLFSVLRRHLRANRRGGAGLPRPGGGQRSIVSGATAGRDESMAAAERACDPHDETDRPRSCTDMALSATPRASWRRQIGRAANSFAPSGLQRARIPPMIARIRLFVAPIHAAISAVDKPRLGRATILGFRPDLAAMAARSAAIERLRVFAADGSMAVGDILETQLRSIDDIGVILEHNKNISKKNLLFAPPQSGGHETRRGRYISPCACRLGEIDPDAAELHVGRRSGRGPPG